MSPHEPPIYDVAVIGAGIVGSAIARRLAGYELDVALVEAKDDVGDGTSKANTAILHTGFDAKPRTLESRLVREGYHRLKEYAEQVGIPLEPTGAILVAWDEEQEEALPALQAKAEQNEYPHTRLLTADQVRRALPHLGPGVRGGLEVPDESIICTWTTNLALATDAVNRGARLLLDHRVERLSRAEGAWSLQTSRGVLRARWLVNAGGLGADHLDRMAGHERFTVTPRRGELIVYDKQARSLVDKIVLPVPTARGKGVLVSPTVFGNVMLGPTAEDLDDRTDTSTSEAGLDFLIEKGRALVPALMEEEVTATYAGLRAATEHGDYVIDLDADQDYILVGGIRSTGLTAGMAIAEHVDDLLLSKGDLRLRPKVTVPDPPKMPSLGEAFVRPFADAARIAEDPAYGTVVCFCERVTAGEIRDALNSTIPPASLGGLSRRTRAGNGRCQGFFCGAEVAEMFAASRGSCCEGDV